jgi:hypothetical protein
MQLANTESDAALQRHCILITWLLHPSSYQPCRNYTHNNVEIEIKMPLTTATEFLDIMTPIAEAVPVLGTPVKGALEATSKILKYAQVRISEDHNE